MMLYTNRNTKVRVGICPVCSAGQHFNHLPKIGKALRCPRCKHWLKVSSRLPIRLEPF